VSNQVAPLQVAVIGTGFFSQFQLQAWAGTPGARLVAVCDSDKAKALAAAQRFGAAHCFDNAAQMLEHLRPDLIDIVTPPASHASLIQLALARSIPVICQKPFGADYAQALALTQAAEAAQVPLVVHENFRFMPWYRFARRMVEDGALGALHNISFRLRTGDGQGPLAYLDRQPYFQTMPRLLVVETAVHFIDTFRYLVGEVSAVYARLRRLNPAITGEDCGIIVFEFSNGAAGVFDGNRLNDHSAHNPRRTLGEMWLEGARGVLRLDGDGRLWFKPHHGQEAPCGNDTGDDQAFGGGACAALQAHVVDCLVHNRQPENTARDYLRNLLIQEAVYASHASGKRIELGSFAPSASPSLPPFSTKEST
jgi:D-apiose dehydrogenase